MQFLDEKESIELVLPVGKYLVVEALTGTGKTVITRIDTTIFSIPRRLKVAEISNERIALGPYDADVRLIVQADTDIVEYDVVDDPSLVVDNSINAATQAALSGKVDKIVGRGLSSNDFTNAEKAKLAGIETGAQVNTVSSVAGRTGAVTLTKSDVGLSNVDNTSDIDKPISYAVENALDGKSDSGHIHVIDEVVGLSAQLATLSAGAALGATAEQASNKGQPGGYVPLNGDGTISPVYLPSGGGIANTDALTEGTTNLYFTQGRVRDTALTGLSTATATAVVATDSVLAASGKLQAQITATNTAVAAKANATDLTAHTTNTSNPHSTTKVQVGLGNVDNTSDLAKPVSTATQTALDAKENAIALGTGSQFFAGNKTWRDLATDVRATVLTGLSTATNAVITATDTVLSAAGKLQKQISDHVANVSNPHSTTKAQVGLGNVDNTSDASKPISTATQTAINAKENLLGSGTTSQYLRGDKTFQTLDKNAVGLGNVDNTSDASKPISTATQTALNAKANNASPTFTGTVTAADLAYTGTLTGGTGAINIGSGQIVKDASGNVGIGTSSPSTKLNVSGSGNQFIRLETTGGAACDWITTLSETYFGPRTSTALAFQTDNAERVHIDASGNVGIGSGPLGSNRLTVVSPATADQRAARFNATTGTDSAVLDIRGSGIHPVIEAVGSRNLILRTNDTDRVTVNTGGNVGIGTTSPGALLDVSGGNIRCLNTTSTAQVQISNTGGSLVLAKDSSTGSNFSEAYSSNIYCDGAHPLRFWTNGTDRARIDANGNFGLGVTPSAWNAALKAVDIGNFGSYLTCGTTAYSASGYTFLGNNAYLTSGSNWVYRQSAPSVQYRQVIGEHQWLTAPSGTAGDAIAFTQAMTLDGSGNLAIGSSSSGYTATGRVTQYINGATSSLLGFGNGGANAGYVGAFDSGLEIAAEGSRSILFTANGAERARIDANGNFGLGATLSAWASGAKMIEAGAYAAIGQGRSGTADLVLSWNAAVTSGTTSGTGYVYKRTGDIASAYEQNGAHRWYTAPSGTAGQPITFAQAMTLDASGNVLVGRTDPPIIWSAASTRVALKGNATNNAAEFIAESNDGLKRIGLFASGTSNDAGLFIPSGTTNLVLGTNGAERARIDVAGNMGIGVTPSLWAGAASRGLEVGAFASLSSSNTYGAGLGFNVWHDGTNYIRRGANVVSFLQCDGSFRFRYAATGAAGSTVTFSDAMIINTSGNVGIGTTSPSQRLHVNGTVQQTGSIVATTARTANYTATTSDYVIRCDPTTAAITVTLPAAASNTGRIYIIKRTTAGANAVTIDANASELIDGALTQTLTTQYQTLRICCNGTGWDII